MGPGRQWCVVAGCRGVANVPRPGESPVRMRPVPGESVTPDQPFQIPSDILVALLC
jgi:hypothetical protein